jgi:hypothetical protein
MARLLVHGVSSAFHRERYRQAWIEEFLDSGGFNIEIEAHTRRVGDLLDVDVAAAPKDLGEAFREYLHEQLEGDPEGHILSALAAEIMEKAREKLLAAEG